MEGAALKGSAARVASLNSLGACTREADVNFLLQEASTVWLARDGRRQRLRIRFRAVDFVAGEIVSRVGVLGHWKDRDTAAPGILDAAKTIVRAAAA